MYQPPISLSVHFNWRFRRGTEKTSQIVADKRVFNSISHLTWKSVLVICGHFHKIRVPGRIFVLAVFLKPGFYEGRNTDVVKEAAGTFACKVTCYPPAWMDRRVQRRGVRFLRVIIGFRRKSYYL